jgi:hypothetical protein
MNTILNILFKNWLIILLLILTIGRVIFLFINYYLMTMNNDYKFEEENRTIIIKSKKSGQSAYINNSQIIKIFHIQGPINGDASWYFFSYFMIAPGFNPGAQPQSGLRPDRMAKPSVIFRTGIEPRRDQGYIR